MSEEYLPEGELDGDGDMYLDEELELDDEVEEITSEEVDRVVAVLEELMESVDSENIKVHLDEASTHIYYLIYEDDENADDISEAA